MLPRSTSVTLGRSDKPRHYSVTGPGRPDARHAHHVVELTGPSGLRWDGGTGAGSHRPAGGGGHGGGGFLRRPAPHTRPLPGQPTLPFAPGMDAAVGARGTARQRIKAGQRSRCGAVRLLEDVMTANPGWTLPLPDEMGFEAAAAAPLDYLTSLLASAPPRLRSRRGAAVHRPAGGVGAAAIQAGRALGLTTIAVNPDNESVPSPRPAARTMRRAVPTGSRRCARPSVRPGSTSSSIRWAVTAWSTACACWPRRAGCCCGLHRGEIPTVKVNRLLLGNIGVLGAASREFFERQPALMGELWNHYLDLRETDALADPPVEVWPFADARQALQAVEDRRSLGKNVLSRHT